EPQRYVRDSNMPQLEVMWLPMDHLAAGRPGKCTPRACMADNDLALGRIRCAEIQTLRQMCCCSILRILFIQVLRGDAQSHAALHALQSSKYRARTSDRSYIFVPQRGLGIEGTKGPLATRERAVRTGASLTARNGVLGLIGQASLF